jgi:integrase
LSRGLGRVFKVKRSKNWQIEYWYCGQQVRETSGSRREKVATDLLKKRLGEIGAGRFVGLQAERTTFEELSAMLIDDYKVNGRKSADRAALSVRHLKGFFEGYRARDITPDRVSAYIRSRLEDKPPAMPSTIRNELAALSRMFTIGYRAGKVGSRPSFPSIRVQNARKGFFEADEVAAVLSNLPEDLQPLVQFTYLTGWRIGEVKGLTWRQVDFKAGVVRLEPGTTKNDEGRVYPFSASPDLADLLERQRQNTTAVERETGKIVPWVFHRHGKQIVNFREAWKLACAAACCPGRLVHDLRRTVVRELERAGVSRSVAMKLTGHKTENIYRRYAIVAEADLADGVARRTRLQASSRTVPAQSADFSIVGDEANRRKSLT